MSSTDYYRVYGIVPAGCPLPDVDAARLIRHGDVAALTSPPLGHRPRKASRAEILKHAHLLDQVAAHAPVLPARFGIVVSGAEVKELLADEVDQLAASLRALRGRAQFTVKANHVCDAVLWEVLHEQPEVAQLRAVVESADADTAYVQRVRLGELVAKALMAKCEADAVTLTQMLTPLAAELLPRPVTGPEASFGASVLVDHARRAEFEAAVEELAQHWAGRARIRLLGPMAPYDFVAATADLTPLGGA